VPYESKFCLARFFQTASRSAAGSDRFHRFSYLFTTIHYQLILSLRGAVPQATWQSRLTCEQLFECKHKIASSGYALLAMTSVSRSRFPASAQFPDTPAQKRLNPPVCWRRKHLSVCGKSVKIYRIAPNGYEICGGVNGTTELPPCNLAFYLRCSTPTCAHISSTGQVEHLGREPVQMCLPKGTSRRLISIQYFCGSLASRANILRSAVDVST